MRLTGETGYLARFTWPPRHAPVVVRVFFKKTRRTPAGRSNWRCDAPGDDDMSKIADCTRNARDPEYQEAYDRLGAEFELTRALIEARTGAGFTQAELAERMETTQSVVARLESGRSTPPPEHWKRLLGNRHPSSDQL